MSFELPPRKVKGISKRLWHRLLVAKKVSRPKPRAPRTKRQKKRTAWMGKSLRWRRVGSEEMFGLDVLAVRTHRKPPTWRLSKVREGGELAYYALRKLRALPNASRSTPSARWELVGPEGYEGVHTAHVTKMGAIRLCADIDESKLEEAAE